jgi:hypothetical protein
VLRFAHDAHRILRQLIDGCRMAKVAIGRHGLAQKLGRLGFAQ